MVIIDVGKLNQHIPSLCFGTSVINEYMQRNFVNLFHY